MHTKMTHAARAELANAIRGRYRSATGEEKHKILDEFVATTGYHQKSAIRALNGERTAKRRQTCNRPSLYDEGNAGGYVAAGVRRAAFEHCLRRKSVGLSR